MSGKRTEACGRCSVTTVLDATEAEGEESSARNPFDGERIEVDEHEIRSVVPHQVWAGRLKDRIDAFATRLIYG